MTQRERTLAFLLLPPLVLFGGGFLVYQGWIEPLRARDKQIRELEAEIDDRQLALANSQKKKKELDKLKPVSLPADTDLARREYAEELSRMLRDSGFEPGNIAIQPKQLEAKTGPTFAKNKPPIYTRLVYIVQAKGDLNSLVAFMEKFYKLKTLHQIRNLSVQRPVSQDRGRGNELDINLTVEALVLDVAEPRKTLLPEKTPDFPDLLAGGERKYAAIAGRDIFYGPAPAAAVEERKPSSTDYAQFIRFNGFTHSENGLELNLHDIFNNQEHLVRPRSDGDGFRVEVSYLLNGKKRTLRSGRTVDVLDEQGELQHRWLVMKANERELYLQDDDGYFVVHIGQRLSEMTRLSSEEAAQAGLIAKNTLPPEKAIAPDDKKD